MHQVLILGAGKIGALISGLLGESGDYSVQLADVDLSSASAVARAHNLDSITPHAIDATNASEIRGHITKYKSDAIVSALPYFRNALVAEVARGTGIHYFDLTEDVKVTRKVQQSADGASTAFVPQCGLAPGFISIAANELITHFDEVREVRLRVGALPQHPNNPLKYALNWSTDGLINEYLNPCAAILDGKHVELMPLEGREEIEIDGTRYEAFNTSGGIGSLAETYGERVERMNYKTIRYPGHCDQVRLLVNGLKLGRDRGTLKRLLENALPRTLQDVVVIYVSVNGIQAGEFIEENYVNKVYPQMIAGRLWAAIQATTAAGVCSVVDLVLAEAEAFRGYIKQEQFSLQQILDNRFGQYFADGDGKDLSTRAVATGTTGRQRD